MRLEDVCRPKPIEGPAVRLRALRSLCGDYGHIHAGNVFETDAERALALEAAGLAEQYRPPAPPPEHLERRVVFPPELAAPLARGRKKRGAK